MENGTIKKISEKLSTTFDNMDEINASYLKIEAVIIEECNAIQKKLNSDNDEEVSREIHHYLSGCINNLLKNLKGETNE